MYLSQGKTTSECFDLPLFCEKKTTTKKTNKQTNKQKKGNKRPPKHMESPSAAVSITPCQLKVMV